MLPNTRLKLAAPVLNGSGYHAELRGDRRTFVNLLIRRRSLSAIR
jgi:hypothetical protein